MMAYSSATCDGKVHGPPESGPLGALESLGKRRRFLPLGHPFFLGEVSAPLEPAPPVVMLPLVNDNIYTDIVTGRPTGTYLHASYTTCPFPHVKWVSRSRKGDKKIINHNKNKIKDQQKYK